MTFLTFTINVHLDKIKADLYTASDMHKNDSNIS